MTISYDGTAFNINDVMDSIILKAPDAVVHTEKRNEVRISLNTTDTTGLAVMFADIEKKYASLGIANVGVTVSTMEDAYIR